MDDIFLWGPYVKMCGGWNLDDDNSLYFFGTFGFHPYTNTQVKGPSL